MRVIFLGTGSWNAQDRRMGPCVLVEHERTRLIVDAGEGCVRRMVGAGIEPGTIDAILITHLHPDHVAGLLSLFFFLRVRGARKKPLDIYGPPGLDDLLAALARMGDADLFSRSLNVRAHEISPPFRGRVGAVRFFARGVEHKKGAMGYRVEAGGRAVAFSGDSAPCDGLIALAKNADLFVCEATASKALKGHMTPEDAARTADAAGAKALALVHIDPAQSPARFAARARRLFTGKVFAAKDLQVVDLG